MPENEGIGTSSVRPGPPFVEAIGHLGPPHGLNVTLPPGMSVAFDRLMKETGKPAGEIVGDALALYIMALNAHRAGKAVGTAPTAEAFETEFVGF